MYKAVIKKLLEKKDLETTEIDFLFTSLMENKLEQTQAAALLTALAAKGFSALELSGAAKNLMSFAKKFSFPDAIDNCGTGGSGLLRFNVSTTAAFVLAAGGVRVAKHGNRGMGGRVGSFDILESLGVPFALDLEQTKKTLEENNLVFLFAPSFHPAMRHVGPIRKELGFKTIFNVLGPLLNPAQVDNQIIGVSNPEDMEKMAEALISLGRKKFMLFFGDGLDEITLTGETKVIEYQGDEAVKYTLKPEDFGLEKVNFDKIAGGGLEENTEKLEKILKGKDISPLSDMVAINAGAGFYLMGIAEDILAGFSRAKEIIRSGEAWQKLLEMKSL